jgi:TonB family protein
MEIKQNQALWTSIVLHLVVLLVLLFGVLLDLFQPKEKLHVFQMVDSPSSSAESSSAAAPELPKLPKLPVMPELMAVPAVAITKPVAPQPVKPADVAQVEPVSPPKTVSYKDFLKKNPLQDRQAAKPRPKVNVELPRIDTSQMRQDLRGILRNAGPVGTEGAVERDALTQYGVRLNTELNRAWLKPVNLAGVRLVATVVFDVSPSGRISNLRMRPDSRNAAFDASVLAAFRSVGGIGVTPSGQAHVFTMSFRMIE